jgi:uncharacterized protein (DUF1800 family)
LSNFTETQSEINTAVQEKSGSNVNLLVPAMSLALAACGSEEMGVAGTGENGDPFMATELEAAGKKNKQPTHAEASRFLGQAQLFATKADIEQVRNEGYKKWLENQFKMPVAQTAWDWLFERGFTTDENIAKVDNFCWKDLLSAPDTLRKRVAFLLSEIFVVSINAGGPQVKFWASAYWDYLNQHAFGNFLDLLRAVTLSSAMGMYLNMRGNMKGDPVTGRQPDENYAREIMQLFTIGLFQLNRDGSVKRNKAGVPIESYTQEDVTELAKVFTGWDLDTRNIAADSPLRFQRPMMHIASRHSTDAKNFLDKKISANTPGEEALEKALQILFKHPNVAPFWAKQLIQKMVTSNPSPNYIERVAKVFEDNGKGVRGDMRAVIAAVLLDREARDDSAIDNPVFGKLREPVARLVQWGRTFGARTADENWMFGNTSPSSNLLGQSPLRAPSVFNFFRPNYVPADAEFASRNMVGPEFQLLNEVSVAGYVNFMTRVVANTTALKVDYSEWLNLANTPATLIDELTLLFAPGRISGATRDAIVQAIGSITLRANNPDWDLRRRLHAAILLIMASPQYLIQK